MGLWLTLSIVGTLLVCCLGESASQEDDIYELEKSFDCSEENPITISNTDSTLRSLTLTSPCYPADYTSCSIVPNCSISVLNVLTNVWIGFCIEQISTSADSEDKLQIATENQTLFTTQLSSTQPGYLYHYSGSLPNNKLFISFDQSMTISSSPTSGSPTSGSPTSGSPTSSSPTNGSPTSDSPTSDSPTSEDVHKFRLNITFAYVIGRVENVIPTETTGFVVSHENFDYGNNENNYYLDDITKELTLEAETTTSVFRLTFLAFKLYRWHWTCYDYLKISGIKRGSMKLCSYNDPTSAVIEVYPVDKTVTLKFVTRNFWSTSVSSGFLLKYQVNELNITSCPPTIQNSKRDETTENGIYIYECEEGYWIGNGSYNQTIDCGDNSWSSDILPCILIECELPEISRDSELNFTLDSRGRATVGTIISYSCNDEEYELTDGTEISTCTSNGEWSSLTPNCTVIVIETTEKTSTATEPSRHTTEGNTTTMASKQETESSAKTASSTAGYIGGGVGAAVVILIVVVFLLILKRRKSRKENYPETLVPGDVTEAHPSTQSGDGGIYYLADEEQSSPNPRKRPLPEVYELAGPMEELDGNRSADSSNSVSEETAKFISPKPAAAASVGAYVDVDVSAGVYSLANEDDADAATITRQPGTTTYDEYELAGPMDAYENANVIERAERMKDISDTYGSVLVDRKTKNAGTTTDVMVDNELYGI